MEEEFKIFNGKITKARLVRKENSHCVCISLTTDITLNGKLMFRSFDIPLYDKYISQYIYSLMECFNVTDITDLASKSISFIFYDSTCYAIGSKRKDLFIPYNINKEMIGRFETPTTNYKIKMYSFEGMKKLINEYIENYC